MLGVLLASYLTVSPMEYRFFVLTHEEVGELQLVVNKGKKPKRGEGCDNIPLTFLEKEQKRPMRIVGHYSTTN